MSRAENTPEQDIVIPKDLFELDYSEKYELDTEEQAKQLSAKILKFLEQFDATGKKKAMGVIDKELYASGASPEDSLFIVSSVYKQLFLSKL